MPSSSRHEERLFFGERIKEIVANDTARLHKKNRDAVTVSPFWRLSITLNDNPEKLRCLPPLTDDLAEKIIMLQAKPAPETIFEGEPEHHLLLLVDKAGLFEGERWEGDAEDLKQTLCSSDAVRGSAVRLMGGVQLATVGIWLSHLASKFPARVQKHRTATKRGWIIQPPAV